MTATRRLATILAADVAEYSRLMGADEEGTLERLKALRSELLDPKIAEHHGRLVKTTGDGLLVEFASVVDAVRCAVEAQQAMPERNTGVAADSRIELRIGINLGDVIVEGDDLYGDGVNIAARIEALADAGGVFVSNTVHDHVRDRLPFLFEDLGEQQVKNIARPVHVYRVRTTLTHPDANAPGSPLSRTAGEGAERRRREAGEGSRALPLPDKPSIAVLPFANMSADREQEHFADGIAEDVITALSRYPSLFVIARNSSFTYKDRAVDMTQVGRELGVRYALEGSLRKSGNRIRVTAQLVEAETGKHVWAERYDRELADIFAVQDEITEAVTISIAPAIAAAEQQRAMRKSPGNLDSWAAYQRGLWHLEKNTADDITLAEALFREAVDLDPNFPGGHTGLAYAHHQAASRRGVPETESVESARRAVRLDANDAEARVCLGFMLLWQGNLEDAFAESEAALALSPNLASAHGLTGSVLNWSGQHDQARIFLEKSIRLDPRNPNLAIRFNAVTVSYYLSGEYDAAVEAAHRTIRLYPDREHDYRWLAAALGQLGRIEEAKEALEKAIAIAPASFGRFVRTRVPWHRPAYYAHMLDGLRKAGWREE
jgi:adenylate cyclase